MCQRYTHKSYSAVSVHKLHFAFLQLLAMCCLHHLCLHLLHQNLVLHENLLKAVFFRVLQPIKQCVCVQILHVKTVKISGLNCKFTFKLEMVVAQCSPRTNEMHTCPQNVVESSATDYYGFLLVVLQPGTGVSLETLQGCLCYRQFVAASLRCGKYCLCTLVRTIWKYYVFPFLIKPKSTVFWRVAICWKSLKSRLPSSPSLLQLSSTLAGSRTIASSLL